MLKISKNRTVWRSSSLIAATQRPRCRKFATISCYLSIHQMLNIQDPSILQLVPDYTINLLQPADLRSDDFAKFQSELSQVLEYIHYSGDKDTLHTIVHTGDRFRNLDRRSADLLNLATGSELDFDKMHNKTEIIKEGRINVCKTIDDMRKHVDACHH